MTTLILYLALDCYNLWLVCASVSFTVFTFRMYSPSNPLKRTISRRWTSQRKTTPAIRWNNWKKHQEKCCQEVRWLISCGGFLPSVWYWIFIHRFSKWNVWRNNQAGVAVAGSKIFPLHHSFLYIINTWALIYKHCFQKMILKSLSRRIYARCKFSNLDGCISVFEVAYHQLPNYSLLTITSFTDRVKEWSIRCQSCSPLTGCPPVGTKALLHFKWFLIMGR